MAYDANEVRCKHFTYYQFVRTTQLSETFHHIFQYAMSKE
jgi:hypothetical protein